MLAAHLAQAVLMLAIPAGAVIAARRRGAAPRVLWLGAATFVASQVVHIPLLAGLTAVARLPGMPHPSEASKHLVNALILGPAAGLCEELARWLSLRFLLAKVRSFREGIFFGIGHGAAEAAILGLLAAITIGVMYALRGRDLASLGVPPEAIGAATAQLEGFFGAPAWTALVAPLERVFAMTIHVACAALVMHGFLVKRRWPLFAAIGWHSLIDAAAAGLAPTYGIPAAEGVAGAAAILSGFILRALWRARPALPGQPAPQE